MTSLYNMIENVDLYEILGSRDGKLLEYAENVLNRAPNRFFGGDDIDLGWFQDNVKAQKGILELKCRLSQLRNEFEIDCKSIKGDSLSDFSGFRSKDEKECSMIHEDSEFRDKVETINKLGNLITYIDGLIWILKDLMKLFQK